MIVQPEREKRNVNDKFFEYERHQIDMLNQEFFRDIELTAQENKVLVWLCGWDEWTLDAVVSVLRKVRGI